MDVLLNHNSNSSRDSHCASDCVGQLASAPAHDAAWHEWPQTPKCTFVSDVRTCSSTRSTSASVDAAASCHAMASAAGCCISVALMRHSETHRSSARLRGQALQRKRGSDAYSCMCRAAVVSEAMASGRAKLLDCVEECGADAALMCDPGLPRVANVMKSAGVFAGLDEAVLCAIRLCLRKVGVACHLDIVDCRHQCCGQSVRKENVLPACSGSPSHASHGSTTLHASR